MRPDQHKQKKNSQYKKKHGIGEKGKEVQKDVKGQKFVKGQGSKQDTCTDTSKKTSTKYVTKNLGETETSESSDSDGDVRAESSKKGFQRRKLVSNWDRYDLPPDEDIAKSKGEDFSKLLQASGSSSAQFRFKDEEEEWISTDQSESLSLDLQDLSNSMSCVPLYKVLRLNKDLFTVEQVEEFERSAAENRSKYETKSLETQSSSLKVLDHKKDNNIEETMPNRTNSLSLETNMLDELLDSVSLGSENTSSAVHNIPNDVKSLENDLDHLLDSENQTDVPGSKSLTSLSKNKPTDNTKITPSPAKPKLDSEDLEDWLDSVLDS